MGKGIRNDILTFFGGNWFGCMKVMTVHMIDDTSDGGRFAKSVCEYFFEILYAKL